LKRGEKKRKASILHALVRTFGWYYFWSAVPFGFQSVLQVSIDFPTISVVFSP